MQQGGEQQLLAAHQQLLHAKELQLDFKPLVLPHPPDWLIALGRLLAKLGPLLKYVFWGGLILGAALLLFLIGREIWRVRFARNKHKRGKPAAEAWRPEPVQARALLNEADRLAEEGRFDEAVHLILFRSIEELDGRKPGSVRPALTSRDIASAEAMPAPARTAFGHIASVVERSFFGGRSLGREEFADCRGAYERFAFAEGWT